MRELVAGDRGKLHVILGPMFSGKSSELIRKIQRYKLAGYKCLVIRFNHDNRYGTDSVATHDGDTIPAVLATSLTEVQQLMHEFSVLGIDEGHFFPDLVEHVSSAADNGKRVVVAGLDGTFQRGAFQPMLDLIPLAESVVKLNAICMSCSSDAPYTRRIGPETQLEVVGGGDKYMAVCGGCFDIALPTKCSPFKHDRHLASPVTTSLRTLKL